MSYDEYTDILAEYFYKSVKENIVSDVDILNLSNISLLKAAEIAKKDGNHEVAIRLESAANKIANKSIHDNNAETIINLDAKKQAERSTVDYIINDINRAKNIGYNNKDDSKDFYVDFDEIKNREMFHRDEVNEMLKNDDLNISSNDKSNNINI